MRLPDNDEIFKVKAVWLGPPRKTLPCRARHDAHGVGLVVFVLLQAVERRLGIVDRSPIDDRSAIGQRDDSSAVHVVDSTAAKGNLTGPRSSCRAAALPAQPEAGHVRTGGRRNR